MYLTVSGVFGAGFLASFPPVFVALCCLIKNTNSYLYSQKWEMVNQTLTGLPCLKESQEDAVTTGTVQNILDESTSKYFFLSACAKVYNHLTGKAMP